MRKVDYGIDAPGVIRNLFVIGGLLLAAVLFARRSSRTESAE
jgi:hypothetical protein